MSKLDDILEDDEVVATLSDTDKRILKPMIKFMIYDMYSEAIKEGDIEDFADRFLQKVKEL